MVVLTLLCNAIDIPRVGTDSAGCRRGSWYEGADTASSRWTVGVPWLIFNSLVLQTLYEGLAPDRNGRSPGILCDLCYGSQLYRFGNRSCKRRINKAPSTRLPLLSVTEQGSRLGAVAGHAARQRDTLLVNLACSPPGDM